MWWHENDSERLLHAKIKRADGDTSFQKLLSKGRTLIRWIRQWASFVKKTVSSLMWMLSQLIPHCKSNRLRRRALREPDTSLADWRWEEVLNLPTNRHTQLRQRASKDATSMTYGTNHIVLNTCHRDATKAYNAMVEQHAPIIAQDSMLERRSHDPVSVINCNVKATFCQSMRTSKIWCSQWSHYWSISLP